MKKGSEEIRTLAVRNVLAGKYSVAQVAEMTGYCIATIYNWISIYKKAMLKYSVTLFTKFTTPLQFLLYVIMNEAKSEITEKINIR